MKKIITAVLAIIMALTITVSVSAAQFVESITNKGAPQLIVIDQLNGKDVVGFITNPDGEKVTTEFLDCFIITSVADAKTDDKIPADAKDILLKVYGELLEGDKLSEVCPELNDIVKEKWDKDKDADDLVIKDLFDISGECTDIKDHINGENILELTFKVGVDADTFITAMVYVDGKWVPVVDCINNGDGTVTVQFDKICPVAFLVPGTTTNSSTVSPATSDVSGVILWGSVMFVSLAAAVAIVIFRRKVNG